MAIGDRRQGGFTYLGALLILLVMLMVSAAAAEVWATMMRREKEAELLFIGDQFKRALLAFYRNMGRLPNSLDELTASAPRGNEPPKRFLRKIYRDPITGNTRWGLIMGSSGGIVGVYSLSHEKPLKIKNFDSDEKIFSDATKYSDWKFVVPINLPPGKN